MPWEPEVLEVIMLKKHLALFGFIIFANITLLLSETINNIQIGRNLCVDEAQNIYTHNDSYSIIKYSPKGKQLLIIGRRGEGPGDIKNIGWFDINPKDKMLYVTERVDGNRRISIFSTDTGKYIDNWKFEFDWHNWEGIQLIQFDHLGNVYIEVAKSSWRWYKSFKIGSLEKAVFKYSCNGKKLKEFYRLESDFMAERPGKGNITIPYCNYLFWKVDSNHVVIRENAKSYISVFNLKGKLIKEIKLPIEKIRITGKDLDMWENNQRSVPFIKKGIAEGWFDIKFWRRNLPFPKYKNLSGYQMFFDSKGFLYSYKFSDESEKENIWLRIDITTGKNSIINFPIERRLRCIKYGYFYFSIYDEEEPMLLKIEESSIIDKDAR
jgi:hypothetical protein